MKLYYFSSGPREKVLRKILEMGVVVEKIFVTDPKVSSKITPTIKLAKKHSIPLAVIEKNHLNIIFSELDPKNLCLSVGFKYLFPENFIEHFNLMLNVHGTLLPHYGGARTLNWIIENGETHSGVTVHKIDSGIDTGPILLQKSFEISPFDTGKSLYKKTIDFEPLVVEEALIILKKGNPFFYNQVRQNVKIYPNRLPEHSRIDPTKPLVELINKIRASDPESYPAFFEYCGEKLGVNLFRLNKQDMSKEDVMTPQVIQQIMFGYLENSDDEIMSLGAQLSQKNLRWVIANHPDNKMRIQLLKLTNIEIGEESVINRGFIVDDHYDHCVRIGKRVAIGANVHLIAKSSPNNSLLGDKLKFLNIAIKDSFVDIHNDAWIGAGSIILPGVVIDEGSIVGAGSVVTKSVGKGEVVAGNPARLLYRI